MKKATIDMMFENNVRAEVIIHIGTTLAHDQWPDIAREAFMEDEQEPIWDAIGLEPPYDMEDEALIFDHLSEHRKYGYLVKFATPVPVNIKPESHRISWGYYAAKWIYSEHYETAAEMALEWRQDFIDRKRKKALEETATGAVYERL